MSQRYVRLASSKKKGKKIPADFTFNWCMATGRILVDFPIPIKVEVDVTGATHLEFFIEEELVVGKLLGIHVRECDTVTFYSEVEDRPRKDALLKAAEVADEWYHNSGHGSPGDEIRALIGSKR